MSEEAKVGLSDEAIAIGSSGQKIESREKKGSVKTWELDRNNCDVERDSSNESDTDESSDSLRAIGIFSMHSCSSEYSFTCFLRPATLAFVSFFVFPILPDQLQEKPSYGKKPLRLERIAKHKCCF